MRAIVAVLVVLAGCTAVATTPAAKAALVVVDVATLVRRYVCARELDPLLGDPRAHAHQVDAGVSSVAATDAGVSE